MCTLSFQPEANGYLIAMNRDELLTRGNARPPEIHAVQGQKALFPIDVEGGTWIAATERGDTWALLNRNGGTRSRKNVSRGQLVLAAIAMSAEDHCTTLLQEVGLFNFLPFRLVGINLERRKVEEWVWDGEQLGSLSYEWRPNHWFSSGLSDTNAAAVRSRLFDAGLLERDCGSNDWLRRMHRSHGDAPGAFSICVHRDDAATVSYTEIEISSRQVQMRYQSGSPCLNAPSQEVVLRLRATEPSRPGRVTDKEQVS